MKWIRTRLKDIGRSNKELACVLDIPAPRISDLIHGRRRLQAHEVLPLSLFLGIPPMTVLLLCDDKENATNYEIYKSLSLGKHEGN